MIENSRRGERERVLSLLYEAQMKGESADQILAALPAAPEPFVVETLRGVSGATEDLDKLIAANSSNWTPDRIASIDFNIMRIGAWELVNRPQLSVAVIVSEAVELAKRFSTEESGRFVNGVLAGVARSVRPEA